MEVQLVNIHRVVLLEPIFLEVDPVNAPSNILMLSPASWPTILPYHPILFTTKESHIDERREKSKHSFGLTKCEVRNNAPLIGL